MIQAQDRYLEELGSLNLNENKEIFLNEKIT
jgi:hypothetical protein